MKPRYIAITDIKGPVPGKKTEVDDIESLVRLLLYANEIDIEGIIACTSVGYAKGGEKKDLDVILQKIAAYKIIKSNLDKHAEGYPEADYLCSISCCGIPAVGKKYGKGFGEEKYNDIAGVNQIISVVDKEDARPVYIGLWGGANTLAQAVWKVWKSRDEKAFNVFISKLRIYAISDQDMGLRWMRDYFGDRLFIIVSPSSGTFLGMRGFVNATWTGMSWDKWYENKIISRRMKIDEKFYGVRQELISNEWLEKNICRQGVYGAEYPLPNFVMEGDTPSYLGIIPNGLNVPEHPDHGGWGGRYEFYKPEKKQFGVTEKYPIWTNATDKIICDDGHLTISAPATIWRWREAFQNDFAARMLWTMTDDYHAANHAPIVILAHPDKMTVTPGSTVALDAAASYDPDGAALFYRWFIYQEAGTCPCDSDIEIKDNRSAQTTLILPCAETVKGTHLHVILEVQDAGTPIMTSYARVILHIV